MNAYLKSDLPIIYADMNVYRYLARRDISVVDPGRFTWVYSQVHLGEVHRNGNTDALEGMRLLRAVEISDILNEEFKSVGNVILRDYVDPYRRYEQHLDAIAGYEDVSEYMLEHIIRAFGADNFKELSQTPNQMREEIERITSILPYEQRQPIVDRAEAVSIDMKSSIERHLKECVPIDRTRNTMGVTSEARKKIERSSSAIDDVWTLISPMAPNITKEQFFGFEPIPRIEGLPRTQHDSILGACLVLNMIGISPDKGLSKREKIKNIICDGQHIGMASYCNALVSADNAIINKARYIYSHLKNITNALHFEYSKGYELNLGINKK